MANQQLVQYIRQILSMGKSREDVKKLIVRTGWSEKDVDEAFAEVDKDAPPHVLPQPSAPPALPASTAPSFFRSAKQPQQAAFQPRVSGGISRKGLGIIAAGILGVLIIGGMSYAYFMRIGPFARPPYGEKDLVSGILGSVARIDTSSYSISGSLNVGPRDQDAKPFVMKVSNAGELRKQYQNDSRRAQDVTAILHALHAYRDNYPSALEKLLSRGLRTQYNYSQLSVTDPATKQNYEYVVTNRGGDFALTINFETRDAVSGIKKAYNFSATSTPISGERVTFTKNSPTYFYLSSAPPKPYLVGISDSLGFFPAEARASLTASAATDWRGESADWKFNLDATGDFGDLTYKVNADALKKDNIYYFKINNIPSLFLGALGNLKGQWIKVDPKAATSTDTYYGGYSYLTSRLPEAEKSYKENRKELTGVIKKAAQIADEEGLLVLKDPVHTERVDGRVLYRYNLKIRKQAIVPFYKRLIKEIDALGIKKSHSIIVDEGYYEYLQSREFDEVFDYYDKNTSLSLWVDAQGFPAIVSYSVRIVPQDFAAQLKDRQVNILFGLALSNINEPLNIKTPDNAKPIEEISRDSSKGGPAMKSRDARRIADIKQIQLALELYFDANQGYPTNLSYLASKYIPALPADPLDKKNYNYAYHQLNGFRDSYHLGANLEDDANYGLSSDRDCNSRTGGGCPLSGKGKWTGLGVFNGDDNKGCGGESDRYCYDVTP